jgi:hypothetical protein
MKLKINGIVDHTDTFENVLINDQYYLKLFKEQDFFNELIIYIR